jgi:DNA polymerase
MGALEMGLTEEELKPLVDAWRDANPNIVQFWWDIDKAAIETVSTKQPHEVGLIEFTYSSGMLFAILPSGRRLCYVRPKLYENKFGRIGLTYEGVGEGKQWLRIGTYGPKLVENIVQAVSRDALAEAMFRLDKAGYKIVMHVHDEAIIDAPKNFGSVEEVCEIMGQPISWARGLPLRADGYETEFYKKD